MKMQIEDEILVKMAVNIAQEQAGSWLQLSKELGIGKTTVYAWKYDLSVPSSQQLLQIFHYIGVTKHVLKGLEEAEKTNAILGGVYRAKKRKDAVRA